MSFGIGISGFRVQGLGFRKPLGFGIACLGSRVQGGSDEGFGHFLAFCGFRCLTKLPNNETGALSSQVTGDHRVPYM